MLRGCLEIIYNLKPLILNSNRYLSFKYSLVLIKFSVGGLHPHTVSFGAAFFKFWVVEVLLKEDVFHSKSLSKSLNFRHHGVANGEAKDNGNENSGIEAHDEQHYEETQGDH